MDEDVSVLDDATLADDARELIWQQRGFKRRQHFLLWSLKPSSLTHAVRARIVSFGGVLAVPWKTYLVLDCLHVGEPAPSIQWQHEGAAIQENSKYQVTHIS